MKSYEIRDEESGLFIGVLLYYEKEKSFIIELADGLDEWQAPLLLTYYVKKGIYTIPRDVSLLWVQERIIPNTRQNIGAILNTHKLKEYDEMKFLELSEGRCSQDSLFIKRIPRLPEFVTERQRGNVAECGIIAEHELLCFFFDGTSRRIDLSKLTSTEGVEKVLRHEPLFRSCRVGTGGYCVTFDDVVDIPAKTLKNAGEKVPVSLEELIHFLKNTLLDTPGCCDLLQCSRQNLAYLQKKKLLSPVQENRKGNLFLKGEVLKNRW